MLDNYKEAIMRLGKVIPDIAKQYNTSSLHIYFDALFCYVVYGVTPNEYIGWKLYAKSHIERKTFYTAILSRKYEKSLNDPAYYDTFWKKNLFNKTFAKFIERDWLFVPESTDEGIQDFLHRHKKVIVKPTNLSSGKGIHIYDNESVAELKRGGIVRRVYKSMQGTFIP